MFEIDKQEFGTFVAELRKQEGLTQKEMASQLFISDKAISKWENGVSIPDTSLLIPLAELLGVSVTELLLCQKVQKGNPMDTKEVENIVKTAISYSEEVPARAYSTVGIRSVFYILSLLIGALGLFLCYQQGTVTEPTLTSAILGAVFGAYFFFFVQTKLPKYHDENRIGGAMDGPFRMNVRGIAFNNSNWPYLVLIGKIWSCAIVGLYPLLSAVMLYFCPDFWLQYERYILLVVLLGGLFVPVYVVGKKYQ